MPNNFNPAAKGASPIVRGKDDDTSTAARWGRRRLGRGIVLRPLWIVLGMLLLTTAFPTATSREQSVFPEQLTTAAAAAAAAAAASSTTTKNEVEFRSSFRPEKSKATSTVVVPPDEDNVLTPDPNNQTVSDSCGAQKNCSSCNTEHLCHWCSADQACHAMGSPHGCWRGASCDDGGGAPDQSDNNSSNTNTTSCDAHTNCIDCGRASKLCHWCAHDNACHELGSVHGCLTGVNCYDNAHCQRAVPEPLVVPTSWSDYQQEIGWIPLIIIATVAGACLCCLTLCCCVASGVKGAYDDLAELAGGHEDEAGDDDEEVLREPLLNPSMSVRADPPAARATEQIHPDDGGNSTVESQEIVHENEEMQQRLLRDEPSGVTPEDYVRMTDDEEDIAEVIPTTTTPLPTTVVHQNVAESRRHHRRRNRHRGRAMQRMYNTCACCYLLSVIVVTVVTLGLIYYFPHPPTFNVCNDEVAWKSVMESVTAAKLDAEIQLLTSIANPNRLSVLLVDGTGSLTHDGELVGTLTFPPSTTIADMAITDILVVASFTPERWAALSIAKEFHKGTLVLSLEVDLTLKVPALFNYERTISVQQQVVQVNTKADRSLCACPTWSDLKCQRTPWMQATLD